MAIQQFQYRAIGNIGNGAQALLLFGSFALHAGLRCNGVALGQRSASMAACQAGLRLMA
jgi:hypothetical protein